MDGVKLWESLMNYLVLWFIKLAFSNIWLLLLLFSDDGPSPLGYLKDGEFLDVLNYCRWRAALMCFPKHNFRLSMLINFLVWLFISEDSPTHEKRHRGWFKTSINACASTIIFPQTLCQKVWVYQRKKQVGIFIPNQCLVKCFPLIFMTHLSRNGLSWWFACSLALGYTGIFILSH